MIKFCGLESLEAVFGVEERNKVVKVLCRRIAEKFAQSCDIVTLSSDLYFLLCRENVRAFANNIATG